MAGEEFLSAYTSEITDVLGVSPTIALILISIVSIWSLIWKGLALWKSAKKHQMIWFVVILVVNTVGILEILYIYIFSKMDFSKKSNKTNKKPIKKSKR